MEEQGLLDGNHIAGIVTDTSLPSEAPSVRDNVHPRQPSAESQHHGEPATIQTADGLHRLGTEAVPQEDDEETDEDSEESEVDDLGEPIKDALRSALDHSFDFAGTYAVASTYESACNPCITIDGFGSVGLPLSIRDATLLRSVCNRAPFGKGERTVIDTEVRDTWELDPARIHFANPHWESWVLNTVLRSVCSGLGVNTTSTLPRCELYKMLLYEAGSHFLPHQDTEKARGMFATIVIVLPSQFEGGQVHVSHGTQSKVFDTSADSFYATTALAWYTDVMREVKPITRGYRLALSYNVIHVAPSLTPQPPAFDGPLQNLERVLRAWQRAEYDEYQDEESPQKLAYILSHTYSHANLSFQRLKGRDSAMVRALREVCDRVGFMIALGSLSYTKRGSPEEGGWNDDDDVTMGEVDETECKVQLIAGPDGEHLGREQELDMDELMVDEDYFDCCSPDDEEYEGYQGNWAGSLEYFYRRTVLLIWPDTQNVSVVRQLGGSEAAVESLSTVTSLRPTTHQLGLVDIALSVSGTQAGRAVADVALRWHDPDMWRKAVNSCRAGSDINIFGEVRLVNAYRAFGFQIVSTALESVIANSLSTSARLQLVAAIQANPHPMDPKADAPATWINAKRVQILSTLKKPEGVDVYPIVSSSWSLGGLTQLRDVVLPQLIAHNLPADWWKTAIRDIQQIEAGDREARFEGWAVPIFEAVKPMYRSFRSFEQTLKLAPDNAFRFQFIDSVAGLVHNKCHFTQWCAEQRTLILATLKNPSTGDILSIISNTWRVAGLTHFQDIILPQLATFHLSYEWWKSLMREFQRAESHVKDGRYEGWADSIFPSAKPIFEEVLSRSKSNVSRFLLIDEVNTCVSEKTLFAAWCTEKRKWAIQSLTAPSSADIPVLMRLQEQETTFLGQILLPKLRAVEYTSELWLPLLETLSSLDKRTTGAALPPDWRQLVKDTLDGPLRKFISQRPTNQARFAQLDALWKSVSGQPHLSDLVLECIRVALSELKLPTVSEIDHLLKALESDANSGQTTFLPQLRKLKCSPDFWKALIRKVHSRAAYLVQKGWTPEGTIAFVKDLVEAAIHQASIQPTTKPPPTYSYYATATLSATSTTVKDLLTLCIETGNKQSASLIFRKIFAGCRTKLAIEHTLVPLFPVLQDILKTHRIAPDAAPFVDFFRQGMTAYAVGLLGPKPHVGAPEWKGARSPCGCADCAHVNTLLAGAAPQVTWRAPQARRTHVEGRLRSAPGLAFSTVRTGGSPHGLNIAKSATYMSIATWKARSAEGLRLLGASGEEALLQKMWAAQPGGLEMIRKALRGEPLPPTAGSGVAPAAASGSAGSATQAASAARLQATGGGAVPLPPPAGSTAATPAVRSTGTGSGFSAVSPPLLQAASAGPTGVRPVTHAGNVPTTSTVPQKRKHVVTHVDIDLTLDHD
ncbi:hypothetical protein BV25DRAFT_1891186 [Artomyces pyxidatus]|uniref:Uncharacterized protein n=1 Tax=Artomyces pyxidatus TaxID=48021 RepID=A0ACB8SRJ4_9AGAM|nr:hypothetical protein BV25DRAFT_1891186 [Artomyces pyxidatus]